MIYNQKVGLPIYALTGFFVCIDFFRSVNQNEKRRYSFKASPYGRGGTVYRDGEGCMCGRTQFIPTGRIQNSHKLRRGDLRSPVLQHGGSKPPPYGIRLLFSSIHSKKSVAGATQRSFTLTLKRCGRDAASHCTH